MKGKEAGVLARSPISGVSERTMRMNPHPMEKSVQILSTMRINVLGTPLKTWVLALRNPVGVPSVTITQLRVLLNIVFLAPRPGSSEAPNMKIPLRG